MKVKYEVYSWKEALNSTSYKRKFISGAIIFALLLILFPYFFRIIENRSDGIKFDDAILYLIPPTNVSILIFLIIWSTAALSIFRCIKEPLICLLFLWSYIILNITRIMSITLLPLEPPVDIIPLMDPISNIFYGGKFITKDLFYSGHTATMFLMFLCLQKKFDKAITLVATFAIGILVLVQHVHYTLDVVVAPLFAYLSYIGSRWFLYQS